jgi:hypothetical protein
VLLATLAPREPLEHLGRLAMLESTAWMALPALLAHRGETGPLVLPGPMVHREGMVPLVLPGPMALLDETGPQQPSERNP